LERFSITNPNFYSLLKDSNLISSSSSEDTLTESKNIDEKEIRRLEKKLGIKSGGKLTKAFEDDGLDGMHVYEQIVCTVQYLIVFFRVTTRG
jgi:nucleolar MIF4G domain-containing protein 1